MKQSIQFNMIFLLLLFLSGFTYVGLVTIPAIAGFRGFCVGFTVAFLTQSLGNSGYLLALVSILPQNLLYIPAVIVMSVCSLCISLNVLRNKINKKHYELSTYFMPYLLTALFVAAVLLAGGLIESYLTPLLVKLIVPYVMKV